MRAEFSAALAEYERILGTRALAAGAPGWQTCANARQVYDEAGLLYSSDTRGRAPYFPRIDGRVFSTLEIPSTLPTLDELLGRPEYPGGEIVGHYLDLLRGNGRDALNVFTLHAEIEGMKKMPLFRALLEACLASGVQFARLDDCARELLRDRGALPVRDIVMAEIDGRSGLVATEGGQGD